MTCRLPSSAQEGSDRELLFRLGSNNGQALDILRRSSLTNLASILQYSLMKYSESPETFSIFPFARCTSPQALPKYSVDSKELQFTWRSRNLAFFRPLPTLVRNSALNRCAVIWVFSTIAWISALRIVYFCATSHSVVIFNFSTSRFFRSFVYVEACGRSTFIVQSGWSLLGSPVRANWPAKMARAKTPGTLNFRIYFTGNEMDMNPT